MSPKQPSLQNRILQHCRCIDRAKLLGLLKKSAKQKSKPNLEKAVEQSVAKVAQRKKNRPVPNYNRELPFFDHREELADAITQNQVVIVCGETGSGKTTQLPQLCVDLGLADKGVIGHTQPRRIAAQSVCQRIAEELQVEVGTAVGYKIRFKDRSHETAFIKIMTDGILLAETQSDRWLNQYSAIIIDEAHERSLNIDLILGYIKQLLGKRNDLKLIVTSATIDPQKFSKYFDDAPIVNISGRSYPVEVRYHAPEDDDRDNLDMLCDAIDELDAIAREDILVFFPGERPIREAAERLTKQYLRDYDILPLYARMSSAEQKRIFQAHSKRRIVLATNIAETSLTVPGIRYVIDTGLARISRYSWRARIQRLPVEKISQASANQRSGRCGRVAPGICIRLYSEDDFESRDTFTEPEILRSNLASVILQMNDLRLEPIHRFDFIESPDSRMINDGYRLLFEIGATDDNDNILPHGHAITRLPVDPRLAHILIRAGQTDCLSEILIIVSALSIQDPRSISAENRQAANETYKQWVDDKSDFIFWLNLWESVHEQQKAQSRNQFSRWCRKQFLSYLRLREWQDIHQQLNQQLKQLKYRFNSSPADTETIHRCLFNGIPSHIGSFDKDKQFQGTRGRQIMIFPGSALSRQTPKWIMAFSLIETSRLFAHSVARFNPQWAMQDAVHLHQYEYYEPHWQPRQGRVAAFRNTRIYGLLLESGKRVNFAAVDPVQSRAIFIQSALVEGDYRTKVEVIKSNRKLIEHYQQQEDKYRRRDILISDKLLFEFYDERLPAEAVDAPSFEAWIKKQTKDQIDELRFLHHDIADPSVDDQNREDYPEILQLRGQTLELEYHFEPGHEFDGVTVKIPLLLLNQFHDQDFERLVPGLLLEKIEALIRSLPGKTRKNFVPAKEFAQACMQRLQPTGSLIENMQSALQAMTGVNVRMADWHPDKLDTHLIMHYALYDKNECVAQGHNLLDLKQRFSDTAREKFDDQVQENDSICRSGLTDWDFDTLEDSVVVGHKQQRIRAYPALVDYQESVAIELFETRSDASFYHGSGIARLFYLRLHDSIKYLRRNLPMIDQTALMYSAIGTQQALVEDILMTAVFNCFLSNKLPDSRQQFNQQLETRRNDFINQANQLAETVHRILEIAAHVRRELDYHSIDAKHKEDMVEQLNGLVYNGFVRDIGYSRLSRVPAYLQAMLKRLQNYKPASSRQDSLLQIILGYQQTYNELYADDSFDYARINDLRWMIEEFRIACFAQPMKTRTPVSEKKIDKLIADIQTGMP